MDRPEPSEGFVDPASLNLDLHNPRAGDRTFETEDEVLSYLIDTADVDELVTSIQSAGWIDFEPMIALREERIVLEGNRRLAALRLLSEPGLRERARYRLPRIAAPKPLPETVRVRWVTDRQEARSFIAFKHINGPAKWDALAKARYAAEWLADGGELDEVSRSIGDTHNTVLRLVNGWRLLQQAEAEGFDIKDITARRFNFSHLYTALARPNVREYLGLDENLATAFQDRPVPADRTGALAELMGWLYGQATQGRQHVVRSQNPDLNQLVRVLGSSPARTVLAAKKDLKVAFEVVEPASARFEEALAGTAISAEKTLGLVSHFDAGRQPHLIDTVGALATTIRALRDEMRRRAAPDDDL